MLPGQWQKGAGALLFVARLGAVCFPWEQGRKFCWRGKERAGAEKGGKRKWLEKVEMVKGRKNGNRILQGTSRAEKGRRCRQFILECAGWHRTGIKG